MKPRVTNLRSRIESGAGAPGQSVVEFEATQLPRHVEVGTAGSSTVVVRLWGLRLNMDPFDRAVGDGVVRELSVRHAGPDCVECRLSLEFPVAATSPTVETLAGLPALVRIRLSRAPLHRVLRGRVVVVDPAHGGPDRGARGPINLEERHVVLKVATRLVHHLTEAGCRVHLTRGDDRPLDGSRRAAVALAARAELFVSLHTGHEADPECRGVRVLYAGSGRNGPAMARELAVRVHRTLCEWPGLPDRGVREAEAALVPEGLLSASWPLVFLAVELVCLANPLEEALMRNSVFRDRLAQALRNGLVRHHIQSPVREGVALAL